MVKTIRINKRAQKDLRRVPGHVAKKLRRWTHDVQTYGLEEVRKVPGYHDEPLKGERKGQRSIRLSRSYRAIYIIDQDGGIAFVSIEEVTKHEY